MSGSSSSSKDDCENLKTRMYGHGRLNAHLDVSVQAAAFHMKPIVPPTLLQPVPDWPPFPARLHQSVPFLSLHALGAPCQLPTVLSLGKIKVEISCQR